jgi:hypothetical protein
VDAIYELLNTVIKITLAAGALFITFSVMRSKKINSTKTDLQNLQARLSQLRLALKAKVKRKSNVLRTMIKSSIIEGDVFDTTTRSLLDVKFESSDDFQTYFDISRNIVGMIHVDNGTTGDAGSENNFMSSDFKTEMDIIRIIKEMIDLSSRINSRVEEHNRTSSQKLQKVDPLTFAASSEVHRVFKVDEAGTENSKAS